ncbi:MAG: cell division protein FtsX [Acidocella sp.]|nr:cell division protein FtsX [Acidocella sp.]
MARLFIRRDDLGLRTAMGEALLPMLVGAMSFLAGLAVAGALASGTLARHWQGDTARAVTIQVPANEANAVPAVLAATRATPGMSDVRVLPVAAVDELLKPWLGDDVAALGLPIPIVIAADGPGGDGSALTASLTRVTPGVLVQTGALWAARVAALTASLRACAAAMLVIVAMVAAAMVTLATRAGIAQRHFEIEIIHGLGALDGDIARRFAARAAWLALLGGAGGSLAAGPVLMWLSGLAAPFAGVAPQSAWPGLSPALWFVLPTLPLLAGGIGWATAQVTVRRWLGRLT